MRCEMAYANSCCPTTPNMRLLRWTGLWPTTCGLDWPVTKKRSRKSALSVREEGGLATALVIFRLLENCRRVSRFRQHARAMAKNASEVIFWITAEICMQRPNPVLQQLRIKDFCHANWHKSARILFGRLRHRSGIGCSSRLRCFIQSHLRIAGSATCIHRFALLGFPTAQNDWVLINAETVQMGFSTKMSGFATNQELASNRSVHRAILPPT